VSGSWPPPPPDPSPDEWPPAAPPRREPGGTTVAAALTAIVIVLLAAAGVWFFRDDLLNRTVVGTPQAASGSARSSTRPPATVPPTAVAPAAELQRQVQDDSTAVEALVGQWIPQLSAKQAGLVVNGRTFDDAAVLADFRASLARFPQARLLRSADYTSFRRPGFFVTVVGQPFATPEAANQWCAQQALGRDDCFAKRLSHTAGPEGNTLAR
jgi:hypothetical protein